MPRPPSRQSVGPAETVQVATTRSATIKDVARIAALSPITVSRALNKPELVRPETVERVRQAVQLTGYIPNLLAGGLASKRSRLVAAIVPQLFNAMFAETVQGLSDRLAESGYQLLLSLSEYSKDREAQLVSAVLSRRPDGIVLTGINHALETRKLLMSSSVPVVETWDLTPTPIDLLVGFSHEKIGETIARHLLGRGCRNFGLVWADDERAAVRRKGLESVLAEHGIRDIPAAIVPLPSAFGLGRQGLSMLLDTGRPLDVVVCSSDTLAQGVLAEAQVRGIAVPRDMKLMGFGDFDFSAYTVPAISSIHIDKRAIGAKAADALIARIEGHPLQERIIDVGFSLVERETTLGRSAPG